MLSIADLPREQSRVGEYGLTCEWRGPNGSGTGLDRFGISPSPTVRCPEHRADRNDSGHCSIPSPSPISSRLRSRSPSLALAHRSRLAPPGFRLTPSQPRSARPSAPRPPPASCGHSLPPVSAKPSTEPSSSCGHSIASSSVGHNTSRGVSKPVFLPVISLLPMASQSNRYQSQLRGRG
jgi:hypothetical protein